MSVNPQIAPSPTLTRRQLQAALACALLPALATTAFAAPQAVTVALQTARPGPVIPSDFTGFSYEKRELTGSLLTPYNRRLVSLFRLLGNGSLRIGGSSADTTGWKGSVPGKPAILPEHVDALAAFAATTGWKIIYGLNFVANTPQNAADEAAYVAGKLGDHLAAFEIGNEPDLYAENNQRPAGWSYGDFVKEWQTMADAIRQRLPNASFAGPATGRDYKGFTTPFARDEAQRLSLLTQHYYRGDGGAGNATMGRLLARDPALESVLSYLREASQAQNLPVRIDECNSYFRGGRAGVSDRFGSALWALDFMFTCALAGVDGVNFHGGSGSAYSAIIDDDGDVDGVRPLFYALVLFAQAARGRVLSVQIGDAGKAGITAYGVLRPDGGVNVFLLNKLEHPLHVSVDLGIHAAGVGVQPLTGLGLSAPHGQRLGGARITAYGELEAAAPVPLDLTNGKAVLTLPGPSAILLISR